jgi:transposase
LKEEWCIPEEQSAEFVCAMEDTLEVYHRPHDPMRPLVCFDEGGKQLTKETRLPLPPRPGDVAKYDYEYERNGTSNLFLFFAPLEAWRHIKVTERRTMVDFAFCMRDLVDIHFPHAEKIVLVMDNLNTHKLASLYEAFAPAEARRIADKLEIHYTPKHGSWLNMAEIELSVLHRQSLKARIPDQPTLIKQVAAWQQKRNDASATVNWRFTTADARIKLKRLYPAIDVC